MRKHWREAPPRINKAIASAMRTSPYAGAQESFRLGYDCAPIETPWLDEIAELEAAKDFAAVGVLKSQHATQIQQEKLAVQLVATRREWAKSTSLEDDNRKAQEAQEAARLEARRVWTQQRAVELRQRDDDARWAKYMATAEAEYDAAHPSHVPAPAEQPAKKANKK